MRVSINGELMHKPVTVESKNLVYVYKMIDGKKVFLRAEDREGKRVVSFQFNSIFSK